MILFWEYSPKAGSVPCPAYSVAEKLGVNFGDIQKIFTAWNNANRPQEIRLFTRKDMTEKGEPFNVYLYLREYRESKHLGLRTNWGWLTLQRNWGKGFRTLDHSMVRWSREIEL